MIRALILEAENADENINALILPIPVRLLPKSNSGQRKQKNEGSL